MMRLHERLLNVAFCLVVAMVVMPTMADDTAFALDQVRLSLDLVLPDAAGVQRSPVLCVTARFCGKCAVVCL